MIYQFHYIKNYIHSCITFILKQILVEYKESKDYMCHDLFIY